MTESPSRPDLRTRLRELRKARGWTLAEVAQKLGTTPQTVSRLETNVMTVSTDWLQKFADLFGIAAADLIAERTMPSIPVIGQVCAGGRITAQPESPLPIQIPMDDAIAVRLAANLGGFRAGSYLVGSNLAGRNLATGLGRTCICQTESGAFWLAQLVEGLEGGYTLVPPEGGDIQYDVPLRSAARVQLELRLVE